MAGMMRIKLSLLLSLATLVGSVSAQNITGSLRGVVRDPASARIAGASISAGLAGSAASRHVFSDSLGEFRFVDLLPGLWRVRVEAQGFAPAVSDVRIAIGTVREAAVTLQLPSFQQTAGVRARASSIATEPLDRSSSVHQSIVTREDLERFPLPERSFANVAYLAPGTEPVEPSDPTKARITAVSTGGSSGLNNELSVDGGDNSDDFIGGFLENFSPDSIEEFAIRTSQEDADTGGTTAGSVVLTTRRGGNDAHGQFAFYERAAALNARYPIENPAPDPKQPFSRQNYVATLGGPLVKEKLSFFSAFESVHEDASIAYSPASSAQFAALAALAADGLIPGVASLTVPPSVSTPFRDYLGIVRIDWSPSNSSHWFLRAANDTYTTRNNLVQQGALPSTGLLTHNNYLSMVVGNQFAFTPNLLGSLTLSAGGLHLTQSRNSDLGFALAFPFSSTSRTVSGFETFGDNQFATPITFFPSLRNQEKYQLRYDISYTRHRHSYRSGVNFLHEPVLDGAFPNNTETLYQFPEDPSYYLNNPAQFTADYNSGSSTSNLGGAFSQNIQRFSIYAEDSWQAAAHLALNYGLRYSTTHGLLDGSGRSQRANPGYVTLAALGIPVAGRAPGDDRKQFAPRLGFAYSPGGGRTVLRGGFGLYYNDLAARVDGPRRFRLSTPLPARASIPSQIQQDWRMQAASPAAPPEDRRTSSMATTAHRTPFTSPAACNTPSATSGRSPRTSSTSRETMVIVPILTWAASTSLRRNSTLRTRHKRPMFPT